MKTKVPATTAAVVAAVVVTSVCVVSLLVRQNGTSGVGGPVLAAFPASTAELTFIDHTGRPVGRQDFAGRFQLVFFGYSHCPDVCPSGLAIMATALRALGDAAERIQPVFISIDPERDTPESLADYVRHFHPRLLGLSGTPEQIAAAAKSYGVYYERSDDQAEGASDYLMAHSARTYLVGPDGVGIAIFSHGSDPEQMAAEILEQMQSYAGSASREDVS